MTPQKTFEDVERAERIQCRHLHRDGPSGRDVGMGLIHMGICDIRGCIVYDRDCIECPRRET